MAVRVNRFKGALRGYHKAGAYIPQTADTINGAGATGAVIPPVIPPAKRGRTWEREASLTADYVPLTKLGTERNLIPEQLQGSGPIVGISTA